MDERDEEIPETPAARPEFTGLSEAEVLDALKQDEDGVIAAEVTRLVARYTMLLKACAERYPTAPPEMLHVTVRWPIEKVAVLTLLELCKAEQAPVERSTLQ